ncbi:MAG: putative membrane protein [Candidatus Nanohaloarchaea archaeon]|jgi:uncharacterized membrane protein
MVEKRKRTVLKAASYRIFATMTVFIVSFLYTGNFASAASIGITAAIAKTLLYYTWERLWTNISWGLKTTK